MWAAARISARGVCGREGEGERAAASAEADARALACLPCTRACAQKNTCAPCWRHALRRARAHARVPPHLQKRVHERSGRDNSSAHHRPRCRARRAAKQQHQRGRAQARRERREAHRDDAIALRDRVSWHLTRADRHQPLLDALAPRGGVLLGEPRRRHDQRHHGRQRIHVGEDAHAGVAALSEHLRGRERARERVPHPRVRMRASATVRTRASVPCQPRPSRRRR